MNAADIATVKKYLGQEYPQSRISYDSENRPEYIGVAPRGAASSASAWLIEKLTYDANGNVTQTQSSTENQIWDDRESITYA